MILLLSQHHEKFDGTGFPTGVKEYEFDDVAQLVSMSDMIDMISKGMWDGKTRNMKEAYLLLDKMETESETPEFFGKELFDFVINWIKSDDAEKSITEAIHVVEHQVEKVVPGS